jgi:cellulose synthase/poly-beta-1,6-N-acetylglucosamine synthase-like glycosyltransferase
MTVLAIALFLISSALLVYVVLGYPVVLAILARKFGRPFKRDEMLRSVSVVIAVRNGEKFIADKLNSILSLDYPKEQIEILVVSDGSHDATESIAAGFADRGVRLLCIPRAGKAAALNLGISEAKNEILILTDVRQTLAVDSVRKLVGCFGDPQVGVASGELSILRGVTDEETDTRLYWNYEVWIRKHMSNLDSTFGANGPFYAMRRELAVVIPEDTLLDDVYLPLAAFFKGYRLVLDDTAKAFDYPTGLGSEFQRKVRTQAGLFQILKDYPQMLTSRNRMRFHFLSGKYGRPLMPWLLLLVAISGCGLPAPFAFWAVSLQCLFYGLAVLDRFVPPSFPLKRLTSPFRTFVMLVLSSVVAVKILFVPPRDLWKETQVRKVGTLS